MNHALPNIPLLIISYHFGMCGAAWLAEHPAYGPLCSKLSDLRNDADMAKAELERRRGEGLYCQEHRVSVLLERLVQCEVNMTGLSHGMRLCCNGPPIENT